MTAARPLTKQQATAIREAFGGRNAARNRMLFILGCNTGFRISELLSLKRSDLIKDEKVVRELQIDSLRMKGKKRSRSVVLNEKTRAAILYYLEESNIVGPDDWIFPSMRDRAVPIDRIQAWRSFDEARKKAEIPFGVGTHAMRKTFGTSIYEYMLELVAQGEKVDPMRAASKALNHLSIANTERYLRLDQSKIDEAIENINI